MLTLKQRHDVFCPCRFSVEMPCVPAEFIDEDVV